MKTWWIASVALCVVGWGEVGTARAATCEMTPTDPDCTCLEDSNPCTAVRKTRVDLDPPYPDQYVCVQDARDGVVCRGSKGGCDLAERCEGKVCPADRVRAKDYVCRAVNGGCDVEEVCDGMNSQCPPNEYVPAGDPSDPSTSCRKARGKCDLDDYCTGDSPECADDVVAAGVGCNDSGGPCDPAETCDGVEPACPVDEILENGYACDDGNACTDDDMCLEGECVGMEVEMCMAPDAGPADAGPADAGVDGDAGLGAGDAGIGSGDDGGGCRVASSAGETSLIGAALLLGLVRRRRRS